MAFAPPFQRPFSATFDRRAAAAAATPWWLAGGAPTPVAVYQPKGAASLAASYVNLANPGTYDAMEQDAVLTWDITSGWKRVSGTGNVNTGIIPAASTWAFMFRFSDYSAVSNFRYIGRTQSGKNMALGLTEDVGAHSYYNSGAVSVSGVNTAGVYAIAGATGYFNGNAETGTIPSPWTGATGTTLYVLGCNGLSETHWPVTIYVQAVAIWNTSTGHATWMPAVSAAAALI